MAGGLRAAPPVVETVGVSKRFGANQALKEVSISIPAGESRALVGRNGAGKSTLVAAITGLIVPDAGTIRLAGAPAPAYTDRAAWRARVACVYQRSTMIPTLTVAENLFLNDQPIRGGRIDWPALQRQAERALADWGLNVDVTLDAAELGVEQRQIVEIARALLKGTRFIILDEPTAQLEGREVARLFERIRRLQESGVTFLYISHHLEEIYEVCRSVTVMRDGRIVAEAPLSEMPKDRLVAAMVGDHAQDLSRRRVRANVTRKDVAPCLDVRNLKVGEIVRDVSFSVAPGECIGIAGLVGSGKEDIADAIAGLIKPEGGTVTVGGEPLPGGRVAETRERGVGYVPRDRHRLGLIPQLGVGENLTMTIVDRFGSAGFISPAARSRTAERLIKSLEVVVSSQDQPIGELSGGNQQKAIMGRALASDPKLLVLVHPTQGVDIASKESLFAIVEKSRGEGTAVLIVSDDLDELVACDRVLVVFKGEIVQSFGSDWGEKEVVAAIEGVGNRE
ncbi:MAG: sugar ABC transporter ATP-binding protein [Bauldia sp.]